MTGHTRTGTAVVAAVFAIGVLCAGCSNSDGNVSLEIRFVEESPADALTEMTMKVWGGERTYYAHREVLLTERNVHAATVVKRENGMPAVELLLDAEGRDKLLELTNRNVGRSLGIIIDGQLQSVSVIQAPIEYGVVRVTGHMLEHGAKRFSRVITRQNA